MRIFMICLVFCGCFQACMLDCHGCEDYPAEIFFENSQPFEWDIFMPNIFADFSTSIPFLVTHDSGDIQSVKISIYYRDELLYEYTEEKDPVNGQINMPTATFIEELEGEVDVVDVLLVAENTDDGKLILRGKLQYVTCDFMRYNVFCAEDCRWQVTFENDEHSRFPC